QHRRTFDASCGYTARGRVDVPAHQLAEAAIDSPKPQGRHIAATLPFGACYPLTCHLARPRQLTKSRRNRAQLLGVAQLWSGERLTYAGLFRACCCRGMSKFV